MKRTPFIAIGIIAIFTIAVAPLCGGQFLSPLLWFGQHSSSVEATLFWQIRLPRMILALVAGSTLGICGLVFQSVFRNPLATPFTLGISSGASFGAALSLRLGMVGTAAIVGIKLFSFLGGMLSVFLVYFLSRVKQRLSVAGMLLAGVAVSFTFSSIILFIQYTADYHGSFQIVRWLMGGLDVVGYDELSYLIPVATIGVLALFRVRNELNLLLTGEELAISRGVNVKRTIWMLFFVASMMVGAVVSVCGPIGFVGMMAPHICRLVVGWNHRVLMPATLVCGGVFLVWCDVLSRILLSPTEIPVGIITAMLGGPFFIWLLAFRSEVECD